MEKKFQNRYTIKSARLQDWDYGRNAIYFITICTAGRKCFLGTIVDNKFNASESGKLAAKLWDEIPQHFPFVILDEFVVMPNHVHGIIIINKNDDARRDAINRVSTGGFAGDKNPMCNDNLSRIVRWYKGRVSFECRQVHVDFGWQTRFHDHIIRNDESYQKIKKYIIENPVNWCQDTIQINYGPNPDPI